MEHDRHRALIDAARCLLSADLRDELVRASLGLSGADQNEASRKTVVLLLHADCDEVLSAVVIRRDPQDAQILVAATAARHRKAGCMRALLRRVAERLAADSVRRLWVGTTRDNTAAGNAYLKLGFRRTSPGAHNFAFVATSADVAHFYMLTLGVAPASLTPAHRAAPPLPRRAAALPACGAARALHGEPSGWPREVPFTSAPVWESQPRATWPQRPCPLVVVRRITDRAHVCFGRYGVFALRDLQPSTEAIMAYAGLLRQKRESDSLYLADAQGGLDVDAETCGNESRYLNTFHRIAARCNTALRAHEDPLTGARWVGVHVVQRIAAGDELLIDYGVSYPADRLVSTAASGRHAAPHAGAAAERKRKRGAHAVLEDTAGADAAAALADADAGADAYAVADADADADAVADADADAVADADADADAGADSDADADADAGADSDADADEGAPCGSRKSARKRRASTKHREASASLWRRFAGVGRVSNSSHLWRAKLVNNGVNVASSGHASFEDAARDRDRLARSVGRTDMNFPQAGETRAVPRGWTPAMVRQHDLAAAGRSAPAEAGEPAVHHADAEGDAELSASEAAEPDEDADADAAAAAGAAASADDVIELLDDEDEDEDEDEDVIVLD